MTEPSAVFKEIKFACTFELVKSPLGKLGRYFSCNVLYSYEEANLEGIVVVQFDDSLGETRPGIF